MEVTIENVRESEEDSHYKPTTGLATALCLSLFIFGVICGATGMWLCS